jgi:hypothetical protein
MQARLSAAGLRAESGAATLRGERKVATAITETDIGRGIFVRQSEGATYKAYCLKVEHVPHEKLAALDPVSWWWTPADGLIWLCFRKEEDAVNALNSMCEEEAANGYD